MLDWLKGFAGVVPEPGATVEVDAATAAYCGHLLTLADRLGEVLSHEARHALYVAIMNGYVTNIYRPFAGREWVICLNNEPGALGYCCHPTREPRMSPSMWESWHTGVLEQEYTRERIA